MKTDMGQTSNSPKDTWDIQDEVDALISSYSGELDATINIEPKISERNPNPTPTEMRLMSMRSFKSAEKGTGTKFMIELCKIADENNLVMTGYLADKGWSGDPGYDVINKKKYKTTDSASRLMNFYKRFGFKRGTKAVSDEGFPFGNIYRMPNAPMSVNESDDEILDLYTNLLCEGHCIMVDIPNKNKILEFVKNLPNECVYEEEGEDYGKETNPHVTVMYGLSENEEGKVKELLNKVPKNIVAELGEISKFENSDTPYDVLKIEVKSPHLARIHEIIKNNFNNNYKWPQYNPHVTLAYVKKGTCNEYVGDKRFEGMKFTFENFTYSNGNREQNHKVNMKEYFVGQSAGYGGGAMAGGQVAPTNWAGTFSSNQTSRRLKDYPASRRYTYMQGNTVIGSSLYDTITQDDLNDPKFTPDEIFAGLRWEMRHMEYPSKDVARPIVIKNLETNPKYYSDLDMYFKSDKPGNIMENIDPKELEMGIEIEHEHTKDDALARKIAMDHLAEDPHYYTKLKKAGLEECGDMEDMGTVMPVSPSVAIVKIAAARDGQEKLSSSGLGSSGAPRTLKSTNLEAPAEKNQVGPNSVVVSKTPPVGGAVTCDPLDHYGSQIQANIEEKW